MSRPVDERLDAFVAESAALDPVLVTFAGIAGRCAAVMPGSVTKTSTECLAAALSVG